MKRVAQVGVASAAAALIWAPLAGALLFSLSQTVWSQAVVVEVYCLQTFLVMLLVAACAGALARPVWTMLGDAPDWRWLMDRTDSPWYPTMRLFRQRRRGDWRGVIDEVGSALTQLAAERQNG